MRRARALGRVLSLNPTELRALAAAALLLPMVDLALKTLGFARTRRLLERRRRRRPPADAPRLIAIYDRMVRTAAAHHLYPLRCLPRSLTLLRLLSGRGIATELRIGVNREGERLLAHAWLEYEGRPIGEPEEVEERFLVLLHEVETTSAS